MENRLLRSQTDRIVGGVCGGLAKYLRIDTVLVRLFFIVFTLVGGFGILAYIILWIVIPSEEQVTGAGPYPHTIDGEVIKDKANTFAHEFEDAVSKPSRKSGIYLGAGLVVIGVYLFIKSLHLPWLAWLNNNVILAALVVLAGVALLVVALRRNQ